MVKMLLQICLFLFYGLAIGKLEAVPFVDASMDSLSNQTDLPLKGTLTITHSEEEKIDPQSFTIEGKPLEASLIKEVKISASSDTWVSIYAFQLPAQDKGLYVLPSIAVKIEGQIYHTTPSTYEVRETTAVQSHATSSTKPSTPIIFRLEASVQGPSSLYLGERTKLFYRISYNRSIDLTRSVLPMIHPAHFQKVGDVQIRDSQLPDVTVQELTQEVEASEFGTFSFGPSWIEGYAYSMQSGEKVYDSSLLKAESPPVSLEVKSFPKINQPASFTGSLGQIQAEVHLTSSDSISVGDTLQLQIKIQGVSNLTELGLPPLQCQPGFSGFFQVSDLPPLAEVKDQAKFFYVELRLLTFLIDQIPSIEVSSFDPVTGKYVVQHSPAIPLAVTANVSEKPSISSILLPTQFSFVDNWPIPLLPPLAIEGNHAEQDQIMRHSQLTSHRILQLIFVCLFFLLMQNYLKKQWKKHIKPKGPKSEEMFKHGLKTENLQILEQAFWLRLWEKKRVSQGFMNLEKVSLEEKIAPIRSFIFQLQALQYGSDKNFDSLQLKQEARELFDKI